MLKIDILTIFPEMIKNILNYGSIKYALKLNKVDINVVDIREFSRDKHKKTDDYPYGGGGGMVMKAEPILEALSSCRNVPVKKLLSAPPANIIYFSPSGKKFDAKMSKKYSKKRRLTLICGRYEDIDWRIRKYTVSEEISIGDFVVSGGELPACIFLDSVLRNIKGVLGNETSAQNDSFENNLLDFPHYTRPEKVNECIVPKYLLSGNHNTIKKEREKESLELTLKNRPDLIEFEKLNTEQKKLFIHWYKTRETRMNGKLYISLLHYPVFNRKGKIVATSVTNLDIHDICRSSATLGIKRYYISNPIETQRNLVKRVIYFWTQGFGSKYHANRNIALSKIVLTQDLKETEKLVYEEEKEKPIIIGTSAKFSTNTEKILTFSGARKIIKSNRPVLLIFGTGWGLTDEIINKCDYILEPVFGVKGFNHLSVRSAVAIILDRLTINNYTDCL